MADMESLADVKSDGAAPALKEPGPPILLKRRASLAAGDAPFWSLPRRVLFRFGLVYFVLYFLPFPLTALASVGMLGGPFGWFAQKVWALSQWFETAIVQNATVWFGYKVLRLEQGAIVIQRTGSGDTMLKYTESALYVAIALLATIAWSLADFRRPAYPRLHWIFRTYVRLALAAVLLGYGLAKIPPAQFQPPGPDRLLQTYGNSSPMGLLWTFMGASPAYTMFAGASEVLAALLLVFRRTATLGGLAAAGVMLNVAMLNFCYDVPVKLFASHLVVASLLVALPDMGRILSVLVLNRPTASAPNVWRRRPPGHGLTAEQLADPMQAIPSGVVCGTCGYALGGSLVGTPCPECGTPPRESLLGTARRPRKWPRFLLLGLEAAFILMIFVPGVYSTVRFWDSRGMNTPKPAIYGLYEVETFELNGEVRPPLLTDDKRWRRLIVTRYGSQPVPNQPPGPRFWTGILHTMSEQKEYVSVAHNEAAGTLELQTRGMGGGQKFSLAMSEPEPGRVVLEGPYKHGPIRVTMKKVPDAEFNLYKRGFHWIQEMPVNQ